MSGQPLISDYIHITVGYAIIPSLATVHVGSRICYTMTTHLTQGQYIHCTIYTSRQDTYKYMFFSILSTVDRENFSVKNRKVDTSTKLKCEHFFTMKLFYHLEYLVPTTVQSTVAFLS